MRLDAVAYAVLHIVGCREHTATLRQGVVAQYLLKQRTGEERTDRAWAFQQLVEHDVDGARVTWIDQVGQELTQRPRNVVRHPHEHVTVTRVGYIDIHIAFLVVGVVVTGLAPLVTVTHGEASQRRGLADTRLREQQEGDSVTYRVDEPRRIVDGEGLGQLDSTHTSPHWFKERISTDIIQQR